MKWIRLKDREETSRNPYVCLSYEQRSGLCTTWWNGCPLTQLVMCRMCWQERREQASFLLPDGEGPLGQDTWRSSACGSPWLPENPSYPQPLFWWREGSPPLECPRHLPKDVHAASISVHRTPNLLRLTHVEAIKRLLWNVRGSPAQA